MERARRKGTVRQRNEDGAERCLYCSTVEDGRTEAVHLSRLVRNTVVKWVTKIHCLCRWINPTDVMKVALIVSQLSGTCILYLTYLSISLNLFEKKRA